MNRRLLPTLFFLSGASSLVIETIFTRLLSYTFGNTAQAVSTVLALFLAGLALGALCVGRLVDRWAPSLRLYGGLELAVGAFSLLSPYFFGLLTRTYVNLYHSFGFGSTGLTALRFGLAAPLILPIAFFMGGTLPAIARFVAAQEEGFEARIDRLYALNTLGAASGTLVAAYLLLPHLGVRGTLWLACGTDFSIFASVIVFAPAALAPAHSEASTVSTTVEGGKLVSTPVAYALLAGGFLTGAVALIYEVTWTHVLAFLIGNSVYAFGLMLSVFLCGLGWGARWVGREFQDPARWPWTLVVSQLALGLVVLLTLPVWNLVPYVFGFGLPGAYEFDLFAVALLGIARLAYIDWRSKKGRPIGGSPWMRANRRRMVVAWLALYVLVSRLLIWRFPSSWFLFGELARLFTAFYLLILPATLVGFAFPLLLNLYTHTRRNAASHVGSLYAANTLGTVLGSLIAGFLLLPWLGSMATVRAAALTSTALGLGLALLLTRPEPRRTMRLAVLAGACVFVFMLTPRQWNESRINQGSYAYFAANGASDRIVYFKEDIQGGLTSVSATGSTHVLLTNSKFQGDNAGQVPQQLAFAFIPALFVSQFDKALVIGLGTGGTLRGVSDLPFRQIEVAELSPNIVEAARLWFRDVNRGVLDSDPRVALKVADGRNDLLLSRDRYDLITIEITSLWISGEGDLYNREFYELCRAHLGERGVLQQWVALHHLRTEDLLVILNTAAQVFPHLAFFVGPSHGLLVASASPLVCNYDAVQNLDSLPGVAEDLKKLNLPSLWSLLGRLTVDEPSMKRLLARMPQLTGLHPDFASSDFLPYLEYQSPKGITLPYESASANLHLLAQFQSNGLPSDLIIHLPSDSERELILGYVAEGRGDRQLALDHYSRVSGSGSARLKAEVEAGRLANEPSGSRPNQ